MGYFYTQKEGEILANLQQIIDFLNRKYPSHGESNANIVLDLEDLHKDIYMRLRRLSNKYDIYEIETVADQLYYELPEDMRIEDIEKVMVSEDAGGTSWRDFTYRGMGDTRIGGRYYGRGADGSLFLLQDRQPIQLNSLKVHLYYFKRPIDLDHDDLEQVPDLDEDYHDLLKFGIVQAMASQGHSPDIEIANYYQQKFDEKFTIIKNDIESKMLDAPMKIPQQREVW